MDDLSDLSELVADPKTFEDQGSNWTPAELLDQESQVIASGGVMLKGQSQGMFLVHHTTIPDPIEERAKTLRMGSQSLCIEVRRWASKPNLFEFGVKV